MTAATLQTQCCQAASKGCRTSCAVTVTELLAAKSRMDLAVAEMVGVAKLANKLLTISVLVLIAQGWSR